MELLVTESDIRKRMSLPEHPDISDAVLSALAAAQIRIESSLGISFERQTARVDTFHVNVRQFWDTLPDDLAILRLRAGFVDKESISLRFYSTLEYAMDPAIAGDLVKPEYWNLRDEDKVKGVIRLNARRFDNYYVKVTYDAGFTDADDTDIPEWLKEAILTRAVAGLTTTTPDNQTPAAVSLLSEQLAQVEQILSPHVRGTVPFSFKPIL